MRTPDTPTATPPRPTPARPSLFETLGLGATPDTPAEQYVTRQTIIAMEQEKYSPSLELAFRIALVFKVPLEEVFSYQPEDGPA